MQILGVVGARPNFIKIDPVFRALEQHPEDFTTLLIHTGQHYDERMSEVFFRELDIRQPDVNLGVGSGSQGQQTAAVLLRIEELLLKDPPDLVLVVGDVNSTMAATLAASKLGIPVAHVEAGLRSFDRKMPEEINRIVTDALSDYLFTSSRDADENLKREGVSPDKIHFVGNVMIDTLLRFRARAADSTVFDRLKIVRRDYFLVTMHRPSSVDHRDVLIGLLAALEAIQEHLTVVFPMHPRTAAAVAKFGLNRKIESIPNLLVIPPQGYLDFLALEAEAALVLTDSGGVQEETTVLGIPCLTMRKNTERPVTVTEGTNILVGHDPQTIIDAVNLVLKRKHGPHDVSGAVPEYWDGSAAERIVQVLRRGSIKRT
jgi:UDP-N-acetylglucosamine 2-epimerase (non-hydrolysing)